MQERTNQELFDYVLNAIRKQGKPSIVNSRCRYIMSDGRRCSAGHLMDRPRENMNGPAGNIRNYQELLDSGVSEEQMSLVRRLQRAHDQAAFMTAFIDVFEENMEGAAEEFGLSYCRV